ncbi:DUF2235 domain-containing protein [Vibrio jasicida]|uniref:DUF2235 domain-containing protein n=1 Tax=Vibrio jasicida TaxID=766224 RepID=UPI0006977B48|nr:DUF2235 domain-containing protein [Vibrio jasicida]
MKYNVPKPNKLGGGYAPVQDTTALTPMPLMSDDDESKDAEFECRIKIHAPKVDLEQLQTGVFSLSKTSNEEEITAWSKEEINEPYRHVNLVCSCNEQEEKSLVHELFSMVGMSEPFKINPQETDEKHINAEFVPFIPAVDVDGQLGYPTHGYLYYFVDGKLVYEMDILGEGRWAWRVTHSTYDIISDDYVSDKVYTSITVPVSIEGAAPPTQYIYYTRARLTTDGLGEVNQSWLDKNATLIDPCLLVDAVGQPTDEGSITTVEVGKACPFGSVSKEHDDPKLSPTVKHIYPQSKSLVNTPVMNVKQVIEKVLRIGVFFDGTGQNNLNDAYKEQRGVKSRTNVARLFEAYPIDEEHEKIYISGVGTVDGAWQTPKTIDDGDDESNAAQAFGVDVNNVSDSLLWEISLPNLIADYTSSRTGAFYKWQKWADEYARITDTLELNGEFESITHIEFDVFGFSRGAALARHFVNALKDGLPDVAKPRDGEMFGSVHPNLLGKASIEQYDNNQGYYPDEIRTSTVRFLGLFDTVGSFYMAGNEDEGNFELDLDMNCAERVFQITAQHEFRKNFPLTSVKQNGVNPAHFFEEEFAGSHSDIGGGYPSKEQYDKQGLPDRYGMPLSSTFNRQLINTESIAGQVRPYDNARSDLGTQKRIAIRKQEQERWSVICKQKGLYGEVKLDRNMLYYYELQPVSNGLSALALERMKQQGEQIGISWLERNYILPQDFTALKGIDSKLVELNQKLLAQPLGEVTRSHWYSEIHQYGSMWIHRPHDALINVGYDSAYEKLVNAVTREGNELKRVVYENEG